MVDSAWNVEETGDIYLWSVSFICLLTRFRCKILFQCPHLDLVGVQFHHLSHHNLFSVEEFQTKWNCLTATVITKSQGKNHRYLIEVVEICVKNICNSGFSSGSQLLLCGPQGCPEYKSHAPRKNHLFIWNFIKFQNLRNVFTVYSKTSLRHHPRLHFFQSDFAFLQLFSNLPTLVSCKIRVE